MTATAASDPPRRPVAPADRVAYTLAEVARMLGRSPRTMRRRYQAGKIPGKPCGTDVMVPAEWVHGYGEWPREQAS